MKDIDIDLSRCSRCGVCVEVCPERFRFTDAGYVQVIEEGNCPEERLREALSNCPRQCIEA